LGRQLWSRARYKRSLFTAARPRVQRCPPRGRLASGRQGYQCDEKQPRDWARGLDLHGAKAFLKSVADAVAWTKDFAGLVPSARHAGCLFTSTGATGRVHPNRADSAKSRRLHRQRWGPVLGMRGARREYRRRRAGVNSGSAIWDWLISGRRSCASLQYCPHRLGVGYPIARDGRRRILVQSRAVTSLAHRFSPGRTNIEPDLRSYLL
jgi:hypothetical protein